MLVEGTAKKYKDLVEKFNIQPFQLSSVLIALVEADYLYGDNVQYMDIDRLLVKDDKEWASILNISGVVIQPKRSGIDLPRVQKLRLLCDTLLLTLKFSKVDLDSCENLHLTSGVSNKVGSLLGISLQSTGYADEDECLRILDCYL